MTRFGDILAVCDVDQRCVDSAAHRFRALLVQRFYNLSDKQTEYQINDLLSFQQFIGWTLADRFQERTYRNRLLTDAQKKEANRQKSKNRV